MKKILLILIVVIVCLCGCTDEPIISTAEVITIRPFSETKEKGIIAVKRKTIEYIEYTFEHGGKTELNRIYASDIKIGDKTEVVIEQYDDWFFSELYLTIEDYKELYEIE